MGHRDHPPTQLPPTIASSAATRRQAPKRWCMEESRRARTGAYVVARLVESIDIEGLAVLVGKCDTLGGV